MFVVRVSFRMTENKPKKQAGVQEPRCQCADVIESPEMVKLKVRQTSARTQTVLHKAETCVVVLHYQRSCMCTYINTRLRTNACLMFAHRLRHRTNSKPSLIGCFVFFVNMCLLLFILSGCFYFEMMGCLHTKNNVSSLTTLLSVVVFCCGVHRSNFSHILEPYRFNYFRFTDVNGRIQWRRGTWVPRPPHFSQNYFKSLLIWPR